MVQQLLYLYPVAVVNNNNNNNYYVKYLIHRFQSWGFVWDVLIYCKFVSENIISGKRDEDTYYILRMEKKYDMRSVENALVFCYCRIR